jgi:hypothetical protein
MSAIKIYLLALGVIFFVATLGSASAVMTDDFNFFEEIRKTVPTVPDKGSMGAYNGTLSLDDPIARCDVDSFVTGIQRFRLRSGVQGPIYHLRYICGQRYVEGAPDIKRTDPSIPEIGNGNYATTEPADGPIAGCPQGSFISGIQGFKADSNLDRVNYFTPEEAPLTSLRYRCRSARDGWYVLRKTDASVPDKGSWPGFTGTANTDDSIAECPGGSFVAAIQGFAYVIPLYAPPISALRYLCRGRTFDDELPRNRGGFLFKHLQGLPGFN